MAVGQLRGEHGGLPEPGQGYLRQRLAQEDPKLHQSLLECWARADDWLSAMAPKKDSFNSYPHLRNVERHLDQLVRQIECVETSGQALFRFSGPELWLLLASVLFHDIGRLKSTEPQGEKTELHIHPSGCWLYRRAEELGAAALLNQKPPRKGDPLLEDHVQSFRDFLGRLTDCLDGEVLEACSLQNREPSAHWPLWLAPDAPFPPVPRSPSPDLSCTQCLEGLREEGRLEQCLHKTPIESIEVDSIEQAAEARDRCSLRNRHCPLFCAVCVLNGWHMQAVTVVERQGPPPKEHAVSSYEMLRDPTIHASLGISSRELAESLAVICLYHGDEKDIRTVCTSDMLNTVLLDPYGQIREQEIAALLLLADHMDSSTLRVLPQYLRQGRDAESVGRFRQHIRGVSLVPTARMIVTELGDWSMSMPRQEKLQQLWEQHALGPPPARPFLQIGFGPLAEGFAALKPRPGMFWDVLCPPGRVGRTGVRTLASRVLADMQVMPRFWEHDSGLVDPRFPHAVHGLGRPDDSTQAMLESLAGDVPILQVTLNDARINAEAMGRIGFHLHAVGLPVWAWLLEYKEHLYTHQGHETFEPIFDKAYLRHVVHRMWQLSQEVFGQSEFTYEALAASLREPNIEKVRCAVRRISIVTRDMNEGHEMGNSGPYANVIWCGQSLWKWAANAQPRHRPDPLLQAAAQARQGVGLLWELICRIGQYRELEEQAQDLQSDAKLDEIKQKVSDLLKASAVDMRRLMKLYQSISPVALQVQAQSHAKTDEEPKELGKQIDDAYDLAEALFMQKENETGRKIVDQVSALTTTWVGEVTKELDLVREELAASLANRLPRLFREVCSAYLVGLEYFRRLVSQNKLGSIPSIVEEAIVGTTAELASAGGGEATAPSGWALRNRTVPCLADLLLTAKGVCRPLFEARDCKISVVDPAAPPRSWAPGNEQIPLPAFLPGETIKRTMEAALEGVRNHVGMVASQYSKQCTLARVGSVEITNGKGDSGVARLLRDLERTAAVMHGSALEAPAEALLELVKNMNALYRAAQSVPEPDPENPGLNAMAVPSALQGRLSSVFVVLWRSLLRAHQLAELLAKDWRQPMRAQQLELVSGEDVKARIDDLAVPYGPSVRSESE